MKFSALLSCSLLVVAPAFAREGIVPVGADNRPLNLGFELGTFANWKADGKAFERPVKGDTVSTRRTDMKSDHDGNFWAGTFENGGDDLRGTLTSVPFKVTHPFASFLVGGGPWPNTRVELVDAATEKTFFQVSGYEGENLRPVLVDLQAHKGKEIFIRIVDNQAGHWGHINFDDFRFHAAKPTLANALDPKKQTVVPEVDAVKFAGLSPEQAAQEIQMPKGFRATLFAGEPDVMQPIAFALDDRGRMWVAEAYTYPRRAPEGQGKDRILILEDTDGDGKFDKRTVFIEGLNLVSGMELGFGGVWVGAAPYLMFIADRNGDDKPDGKPEIVLDGWAYQDTHETLNTFQWGPDGWLYGCHGVFTHSNVGKPGAPNDQRTRINAGIWRYHPIKGLFEVFAEGTSNPWGIDFDDRGQCFIEACVIPHFWHIIQGGRYQRQAGSHFNPHIYADITTHGDHVHYAGAQGPHAANGRSDSAGGGHAHAGLMAYLGDSWPAEYRDKLFMNNIHGQRLNMDSAERRGSGYVGKHGPDFLFFHDKWSQVLNFTYDQNGSVYIIDWYDKNQCHHNDAANHDRSNGRIYKVIYGDTKFTSVDLRKLSNEELVELQTHKNDWYVRHARRLLQERAPKWSKEEKAAVDKALSAMVTREKDETRRLRAIWAMHATGGLSDDEVLHLLKDSSEYVRSWAIQLASEDHQISDPLMREFVTLAERDPSQMVRLYLASAAQRMTVDSRWPLVTALSLHDQDALDHNLPLMVWYAAEPLGAQNHERALQLAANSKLPTLLQFTARRVAAVNKPEAYAALVAAINRYDDDKRRLDLLKGLAFSLKGQRGLAMPRGWDDIEAKLGASPNTEIRAQVQSLSLMFGSGQALAALRKTVIDPNADLKARTTAMESLVNARDSLLPPLLHRLLNEVDLRGAAIRALAGFDDAKTAPEIISIYPALNAPEKKDALNTLASRVTFAKLLLEAVETNNVPKKDLTAEIVRNLHNLRNPQIDRDLQKVWGLSRETDADKKKVIAKYKGIYASGGSQPGDASRGRLVYNKICFQCHTLFDVGGKVGPDLTGSNRGDLDYILQNMIDPNAVIPNDYRSATVETKDDRIITGIVSKQDDSAVTITTQNETMVVLRSDIKAQQQSDISMMPEGLLEQLTDQDVRDLIYYLSRPAQVPLPAQ